MMTWSRSRTLIAGAALILATNIVVLAGAAYNRMDAPESTLALTQRELGLPYSFGFGGENSGFALNLKWRVLSGEANDDTVVMIGYVGAGGTPAWLDQAKLATLGFDVSKFENATDSRAHYARLLPKEALLVLEMDGPTYQTALERARRYLQKQELLLATNEGKKEFEGRVKNAKLQLEREELQNSRLFVVDAGTKLDALRAKYPDRARYAIVRGEVQPRLTTNKTGSRLSGYIGNLSVNQINVPLVYQRVFEPILKNTRRGQSHPASPYVVSVAFGKRLEPWITAASGKQIESASGATSQPDRTIR